MNFTQRFVQIVSQIRLFNELISSKRIKFRSIGYSFNIADKILVGNLPKILNFHGATGEEITKGVDMTNKTCLITGGTSGIGAEMVRILMKRNCRVLMACRNPYKANYLAKTEWGFPERLTTYNVELCSLKSVKKTSEQILKKEKKIDLVILNAGVFGIPWTLTEDGFETTVQVNYLSQYYLLMNIQRLLTTDARVVLMSSNSHRYVKWSHKDIMCPTKETISLPRRNYTSIKAYNISKMCGLLAMNSLGYRWSKTQRTILAAHPGAFIMTNLCSNWWIYEALYIIMIPFSKSVAQASATPLFCATHPKFKNQSVVYVKDCRERLPSSLARDNLLAFRITELTNTLLEKAVGFIDQDAVVLKVEEEKEPEKVAEESKSIDKSIVTPAEQILSSKTKSREEEAGRVVSA